MINCIIVGLGGFLGAVLRYLIGLLPVNTQERVPGQNTGDKYRRCVRDRTGCGTGSVKRMESAADPVFKGWLMWRFYDIFLFRT